MSTNTPRTDGMFEKVNNRNQLSALAEMTVFARQLEKELAALREDKARLDWLEEQRTSVIPYWPDGNLQWEVSGFEGPTLRIAVDAARKEATP